MNLQVTSIIFIGMKPFGKLKANIRAYDQSGQYHISVEIRDSPRAYDQTLIISSRDFIFCFPKRCHTNGDSVFYL